MKIVPLLAAFALVTLAGSGCANPREEQPAPAREPPPPAGSATPSPAVPSSAVPAPAGQAAAPADFPPSCVAYAELVGRLRTCDKLGGARAGFAQAFERLRSAWSKAPERQRASLATQCQRQAESLRNAVAATCGW